VPGREIRKFDTIVRGLGLPLVSNAAQLITFFKVNYKSCLSNAPGCWMLDLTVCPTYWATVAPVESSMRFLYLKDELLK